MRTRNTTLALPATAPALVFGALMFGVMLVAGCQDSGADRFVQYSETAPEVPAAASDEGPDVDATDHVPEGSPATAAEPSVTVTTLPEETERPVAAVTELVDEPEQTDSDVPGKNGTPASSVSDRSDAMEEIARQRAAVLAAYAKATAPAGAEPVDIQAVSEPREMKLLIPEKHFRTEGDAGALRLSYDDIDLLKVLNMEPVPVDAAEHFPEWLNDLDGTPVRIRGFMYPTYQATGLTAFTMARDNGICCFVRKPKIYDIIGIRLAEGEETDYIEGKPFDVEGVFRIVPEADETALYRLYCIEDGRILQ
ncbi:MAG: hypothetical protein R3C19_09470 [Planctomycetaceae bacterium]